MTGAGRTASPILFFLVGPTATGKTALAVDVAEEIGAEIISADSVQFYEELKIGSARPSDLELARVKHHFVGHVSVASDYTAGDFERDAMALVRSQPQKNFIVVGGSGFYIQAFEKGMYPIHRKNEDIQNRLERRIDVEGLLAIHQELVRRDPETAAKIAPQDRYRIVRALEILETMAPGETLSKMKYDFELEAKNRFPERRLATFGLRLDRARLEPRVLLRAKSMLENGLIEEVRTLVAKGFADRPALQSVGYKEVLQHVRGELSLESLDAMIVQGTLKLAKKQRTWFARGLETTWFDADSERERAKNEILRALD